MAQDALDDDVRALVQVAHLCFAATVGPDGRPNLSPKGTVRVLDGRRLFFLDLASPNTRRNLAANPWMEMCVVDPLSRRGYRFLGRATLHRDDEVFRVATRRVFEEDGREYPTHAVVVLHVERVLPVVSPGYDSTPDEWAMRAAWKEKRGRLDAEFEEHVRRRGPQRGRPPPPVFE
jgi:uncharacterized protein